MQKTISKFRTQNCKMIKIQIFLHITWRMCSIVCTCTVKINHHSSVLFSLKLFSSIYWMSVGQRHQNSVGVYPAHHYKPCSIEEKWKKIAAKWDGFEFYFKTMPWLIKWPTQAINQKGAAFTITMKWQPVISFDYVYHYKSEPKQSVIIQFQN